MAILWAIMGAVLLFGIFGAMYVNEGEISLESITSKGGSIYEKFTKEDIIGNSLTIFIPKNPEPDQTISLQLTDDERGINQDVSGLVYVNTTKSILPPVEGKIQTCSITDFNGCNILAYAKLIHPVSNVPIKPYQYSYLITIECEPVIIGYDYCTTEFFSTRGTTVDGGTDADGNDLGGKVSFKWRPSNNHSVAMYDIIIHITSGIIEGVVPETSVEFNDTFKINLTA